MQFSYLNQPKFTGNIRSELDDFCVDEIQSTDFSGDGEHLWIHIQKSGSNTWFIAQKISKALGIDNTNVSYAGLKDRHAVTTQWFSAQIPGQASHESFELGEGIVILKMERHHKKLRRGQLEGYRFSITVRDVDGQADQLDERIDSMRTVGLPS